MSTHNICFCEALLMSTHNVCFYGELEKIIPELSSNTPPYQVSCQYMRLTETAININFQEHK